MKHKYSPAMKGAIVLNKNLCLAYTIVELPVMGTIIVFEQQFVYQAILPLN